MHLRDHPPAPGGREPHAGPVQHAPWVPLDGGRVLRAAAWGVTGNYWLAARIAARMGQGTGALMAVGGLVLAVLEFGQLGVAGIWFALIGAFLLVAATTSYRQEREREGLLRYRVADIMTDRWGNRQPGVCRVRPCSPKARFYLPLRVRRNAVAGPIDGGPGESWTGCPGLHRQPRPCPRRRNPGQVSSG